MNFKDIEQRISCIGTYHIDVPLSRFKHFMETLRKDVDLDLNPDFQRGRVWNQEQKEKYIEFFLSGGLTGRDIYFNCPAYNRIFDSEFNPEWFVCVDGLQRITTIEEFLEDKVKAFGHYYSEFEDSPRDSTTRLTFYVNGLKTKSEIIKWYLQLNESGEPHTEEELNRVRNLLNEID